MCYSRVDSLFWYSYHLQKQVQRTILHFFSFSRKNRFQFFLNPENFFLENFSGHFFFLVTKFDLQINQQEKNQFYKQTKKHPIHPRTQQPTNNIEIFFNFPNYHHHQIQMEISEDQGKLTSPNQPIHPRTINQKKKSENKKNCYNNNNKNQAFG